MNEKYFSIHKAAEWLGVSPTTLRRWEEKGVLIPERTVGNQRRYTLTALLAFKAKSAPPRLSNFQPQNTTVTTPVTAYVQQEAPVSKPIIVSPLSATAFTNPQPPVREVSTNELYTPLSSNTAERANFLEQNRNRRNFFSANRYMVIGFFVVAGIIMLSASQFSGSVKNASSDVQGQNNASVLAAKSKGRNLVGDVLFNIPAIFEGKVTINNKFEVNGESLFTEDITVADKNVDLGTGELTASNVVYGLTAGANISITGDPQNPVISASVNLPEAVTTFQGQTGAITLTTGSGIGLNGLEISNTGVLSLGGQTGAVSLSGGSGISVSGTTISNTDTGSAQNIFKTVLVDATSIIAGSNSDTLSFEAGAGIVLTPDAATKKITITSNASGTLSGLATNGVLYATSSTNATTTAAGANGTVLKGVTAGAPVFGAVSLSADVSGLLPVANGGTGVSTTPSNGQLLIGNGSGYTLGTIAAGSGVGVSNGAGTITVTNNGVLSMAGTANQVSVSGATGNVTLSLPQNIHTAATPTFASMTLTSNTNQLTLGTGNTGVISLATLTSGQTYTLPNASGEICLSIGNCPGGGGGTIGGSGTTNYLSKFTSATDIGNSLIYDTGQKVGIGTISPQGLFSVSGASAGTALVSLNETGGQSILTGSASGTTRFTFDNAGNLNLTSGSYQIGGTNVLTSNSLGSNVVSSSLTSVGTLNGGSISNGFGSIDIGTDALTAGDITASGATGLTVSANGAGLTFSGSGTHTIAASGGTLQIGAATLTGALNANNQNITGINDLRADNTITFDAFTSNGGILYTNASGQLSQVTAGTSTQILKGGTTPSFGAINLASTEVSGTLATGNGGTGLASYATGDLLYASGVNTLAARTIGSAGQILTVSGGVPVWSDAAGTVNFWQRANGALAPLNVTDDFLLGSSATQSAKFSVRNIAGGVPTASVSAGTGNSALYITGDGTLATTNEQTLTLGSSSTGNIVLNGFGSGIVKTNASGVLSSGAIDLASIEVSGILAVTNGGTGANNASGARSNLGAAASGANADITSLTGLTTALSVPQGGTGAITFTSNGVLFGNATGAIGATTAGTNGQILLGQTSGAPIFRALGGDATINSADGVLTIGANAVALATDTTGDYVARIATGSGILVSGTFGEDSNPTVSLGALTADWNQTGAFDITLNNAGSELRILESAGATFFGTVDVGDLTANRTYTFPDADGNVCLSIGNCAGGAGGSKWQLASNVIAPLTATDRVVLGGNTSTAFQFEVNGRQTGKALVSLNETGNQDIFTASASGITRFTIANNGNLQFAGNTSFINTITSLATANQTITIPNLSGSNDTVCLVALGNCAGTGSGVTQSGTNVSGRLAFFTSDNDITSDSSLNWDNTNKLFGIGSASPVSKLDVSSSVTGKALVNFNETGGNDIFTASASGTTRLTLSNGGNLNLVGGVYQSNGVSGITQASASCVTTANGIVTGTGACQLGSEQWVVSNGAIYTGNQSLDLLLGSNATSSAKFAVTNISGGTPTATISASSGNNAAFLTGAGNLGTTNGQTLTVGGASTGNILLDSGSGQIMLADATLLSSALTVNGATTLNGGFTFGDNGDTGSINTSDWDISTSGDLSGIGSIAFDSTLTQTGAGQVTFTGNVDATSGLDVTGADLTVNGNATITTAGAISGTQLDIDGTLRLNGTTLATIGGGNDLILDAAGGDIVSSNRFTLGTQTPGLGLLNVTGAQTGKALAIFDETGNQAIFTASASGTTRFTIANNGTLTASAYTTGVARFDANGTISSGTVDLSSSSYVANTLGTTNGGTGLNINPTSILDGQLLIGNNGSDGFTLATLTAGSGISITNGSGGITIAQNGVGSSKWAQNEALGILYPNLGTLDLLVGGSTTNSAKFAITGVSGTATTATVSGATGATYLTNAGNLQTTGYQQLTLGGSTTGGIVLDSGNGGISLLDSTIIAASLNQTGAGQVTFSGNIDANNGIDVSGADLTVNGNATITTAGIITGTQINADNVRLDGNTLSATTGNLLLSAATGDIVTSNRITIGSQTPGLGLLNVLGAQTGKALAILNETGNQDIFTASSAGTTRFTIANNGQITAGAYTTGIAKFSPSGLISSSAIDLASADVTGILGAANGGTGQSTYAIGDLLVGNGSNALSKLSVGGNGSVLTVQSGTPTWVASSSLNFWQRTNGALAPLNLSDDLLLGGASTASARFAFINNIGSGTPTASISANSGNNSTSLNGLGVLGTTNAQTLTLGSASTGNVSLAPGGTAALTALANGNVGIGTAAPTADLEVEKNSGGGGIVDIKANNTNAAGYSHFELESDTRRFALGTGGSGTAAANGFYIQDVTANETRLVIDSSGRVGIGSGNPTLRATLDVRSLIGTQPIASFSGSTTNAGVIVDNNGSGDLFTASKSGATKFVITNAGDVGIGTNTPNALLDVKGPSTGRVLVGVIPTVPTFGAIGFQSTLNSVNYALAGDVNTTILNAPIGKPIQFRINNANMMTLDANGNLGIGTTAPAATLDIIGTSGTTSIASLSGNTANAGLIVDNTGLGDLFTASKSGASKFTVKNNGDVVFNNYNTAGGVFYGTATGTLGLSAQGSTGQCLTSNGSTAPSWSTCSAGANLWQVNSGAISPSNSTYDVLFGGTATTSAKFAFLNNTGSGTPTASISGSNNNAVSLTATGILGTTNAQTLQLGTTGTGNVSLNPGGSTALTAIANGNVGIGTTTPTQALSIGNGGLLINRNSGDPYLIFSANDTAVSQIRGTSGGGLIITNSNSATTWATFDSAGKVGIGATSPLATLDVRGQSATLPIASLSGSTTNAGLIVDNNGTGDLFNASKSGATKFVIKNSGNVGIGTATPNEQLEITGNFRLPTTTATTGIIKSGANNLIHTFGTDNFFSGVNAGNFTLSGSGNVGIGRTALDALTSGSSNVAIGVDALGATNTGFQNVGIGGNALLLNQSGYNNVALGINSLFSNVDGYNNFGLGTGALFSNSSGFQNFGLGINALGSNTLGNNNIALGFQAGLTAIAANANVSGSNNLFIGYNAGPNTPVQLTNAGAIGANALVETSNNLILGGTGANAISVGIGTTSAIATFDVRGRLGTQPIASLSGQTAAAGLVVDNTGLGDLFTASKSGASKFTVKNNGDVVFNNYNTAGGVFYGTSTGTLGLSAQGSTGQCLTSNGSTAPSWATCSAGANLWQVNSGALSPSNSTYDVLFGGTASNSAKFAFLNNTGSGTPTASISGSTAGNAVFLTGDGTLSTTLNRSLSINPNGGNVGIGITNPGYKLDLGTGAVQGRLGSALVGDWPASSGYAFFGHSGLTQTAVGNYGLLQDNTGSTYLNAASGNLIAFRINNVDRARLDSSGNFGIGTISPTALLDVAGAASVSGSLNFRTGVGAIQTTANNTLNVGGNTTGDITFKPGNSSASLFLGSNGNVGIGTTTPGFKLDLSAASSLLGHFESTGANNAGVYIDNAAGGNQSFLSLQDAGVGKFQIGKDVDNTFFIYDNALNRAFLQTTTAGNLALQATGGNLGVGTTTPIAKLDVRGTSGTSSVASISGSTTNAGLIVDNNGTGDLFTASKSGATKFTILNNGNIQANNYTGQNGVLYGTQNTGVFQQATTGTSGLCLLSGASSPTWGSCEGGIDSWTTNNALGLVHTSNTTMDVLIGGTATNSAKFGFLNVAGGTPTASISGSNNNAVSLTATGILGTTNAQTLQLGSTGTGNVVLAPNGSTALTALTNGNVGIGTSSPTNKFVVALGANEIAQLNNDPALSASGIWGTNIGFLSQAGEAQITTRGSSPLTFATGGTINNMAQGTEWMRLDATGNLGIGTTTPLARLDVRGNSGTTPIASLSGSTTNAGLIVNNNGLGDLFTASKSGATKFVIKNNGDLRATNYNTAGGVFYGQADGTLGLSAAGSTGQCLQSNASGAPTWGACDGAGSVNVFTTTNGLIHNGNLTTDFAIGGNTSASAKFQVSISGTRPTASISATTANAGLVVDNTIGDLFAASSSGLNRFVIKQNGNVGIGTSNPVYPLDVTTNRTGFANIFITNSSTANNAGSAIGAGETTTNFTQLLNLNNSYTPNGLFQPNRTMLRQHAQSGSNGLVLVTEQTAPIIFATGGTAASNERMRIDSSGTIGIGTTTPLATLDIRGISGTTPIASVSGQTSNAGLIVDNNGTGDLFTASKSGAKKFTVLNNGDVQITNLSTAGGVLYTNGSGTVAQSAQGASGQCLQSQGVTGVPVWGACDSAASVNAFTTANGLVYSSNTTTDFAIGGTSTDSAKFAITNVNGSASPIATLSATTSSGGTGAGLVLDSSTSTLQSLLNRTLTLGGNTTGDIVLSGDTRVSGHMALGATAVLSTAQLLSIKETLTDPTSPRGINLELGASLTADSTTAGAGISNTYTISGTGNQTAGGGVRSVGITNNMTWNSSGTASNLLSSENIVTAGASSGPITLARAVYGRIDNNSASTISTANALEAAAPTGTGAFGNYRGLLVNNLGGSTVTNTVGAAIVNQSGSTNNTNLLLGTSTAPSGSYSIYNSSTYNNYFAGAIGIGATTPLATLDVRGLSGTTPIASFSGSTTNAGLIVDNTGTGDLFTASSAGLNRFVIKQNGNVGIGTTSPTALLDVAGAASVSGSLNFRTGAGAIQTTANNTLTVGGDTTGDIQFRPGNATNGLFLSSNGAVGIGNSASTTQAGLYVRTFGRPTTDASVAIQQAAAQTGDLLQFYNSSAVLLAKFDSSANLAVPNLVDLAGTGPYLAFGGAAAILDTRSGSNTGLVLKAGGATQTGNLLELQNSGGTVISKFTGTGQLGIGTGTSNVLGTLDIRSLSGTLPIASISGQTTNAGLLVDNTGTGDLFTASKSGATKFTINNAGNIVGANYTIDQGIVFTNANTPGLFKQTAAPGSAGLCLQSAAANGTPAWGSCDSAASVNAFTIQNGLLYNGNLTTDFAIGGLSSASAKFLVSISGTRPTASVSGSTSNAALIVDNTGTGDLFTASKSGATKFVIKNSGQVGIGTANPAAVLSILTNFAGLGADNSGLRLGSNTNVVATLNEIAAEEGGLRLYNNGVETIRIRAGVTDSYFNAGGNFGIGTSSPLAKLDVRGLSGTLPVASVSGQTAQAALLVDNNGVGDLFTASKSGATKFVINNAGNVGIGTTSPVAKLSINNLNSTSNLTNAQATLYTGGASNKGMIIQAANGQSETLLEFQDETGAILANVSQTGRWRAANGSVSSPSYSFNNDADTGFYSGGNNSDTINIAAGGVQRVTFNGSGQVGIGTATPLATLDIRGQSGTLPIASMSGQTSNAGLLVDNTGTGDLFTASKSGATKFTINNEGNIVGANYALDQGIVFTNANTPGLFKQTAAPGSAGLCLQSAAANGTPAWGSCDSAASVNAFTIQNGLLYNGNLTTDFAIGGLSSASAKFLVSISGTRPTASVSANTSFAGLVVDNTGTGDLFTASKSGATKFAITNGGTVAIGQFPRTSTTTNPAGTLHLWGLGTLGSESIIYFGDRGDAGNPYIREAGSGDTDRLELGGRAGVAFATGSSSSERMRIDTNGNVSINTTTPLATFDVRGISGTTPVASFSGSTTNAGLIVDNIGNGDLFTASSSGLNRFVVKQNGNVGIGTTLPTAMLDVAGAASVSGSLNFRTGVGAIQTTGKNSLTLGGTTTGNILINPNVFAAIKPVNDSTSAFLLENAAGTDYFMGDATNSRVAVGAVAPSANFQVTASKNVLTDAGAATNYLQILRHNNGTDGQGAGLGFIAETADTDVGANIIFTRNGGGGRGDLSFGVKQSGGTGAAPTEMLRLNSAGTSSLATTTFTLTGSTTISGTVGVGTITPLAKLDVRGQSATLPVASFSGSTNFAAMVVNNSGTGDLLTASKGGATKFTITNTGNVQLSGDMISYASNSASITNDGSTAFINALPDSGSMAPNSGFEASSSAGLGFADGWVKHSSSSGALRVDTAQASQGNNSIRVTLGSGGAAGMFSACVPLAMGITTSGYTVSLHAKPNATGNTPTVRTYLNGYTSKTRCEQNTSPTLLGPGTPAITWSGTNWVAYSSGNILTSNTTINNWGRVQVSVMSSGQANTIFIDGVRLIPNVVTTGLDYAENYPADPNDIPVAGDVVSLTTSGSATFVSPSKKYKDQKVIGIMSTQPGQTLDDGSVPDPKVAVALAGRVPVKVSTKNGVIHVGDYLTSSDIPGVAVKATTAGPAVGKAMEDYLETDITKIGQIVTFVNNTWYTPPLTLGSDNEGLSYDYIAASMAAVANLTTEVSSTSGQLALLASQFATLSNRLAFLENNASVSAMLGTQSGGFTASSAAELGLDNLDVDDATVSGTLSVLGRTTLSDVGITGTINVGLLSINGLDDEGTASINTTAGPLKLQSTGINGLDILNGKVTINTSGNIKTEGTVTTKKLNIDITDVAGASLGEAILKAGTTKVTVSTTALTAQSKIFVQAQDVPVSTAVKKIDIDTFEIRVATTNAADVKMNWWIVN